MEANIQFAYNGNVNSLFDESKSQLEEKDFEIPDALARRRTKLYLRMNYFKKSNWDIEFSSSSSCFFVSKASHIQLPRKLLFSFCTIAV